MFLSALPRGPWLRGCAIGGAWLPSAPMVMKAGVKVQAWSGEHHFHPLLSQPSHLSLPCCEGCWEILRCSRDIQGCGTSLMQAWRGGLQLGFQENFLIIREFGSETRRVPGPRILELGSQLLPFAPARNHVQTHISILKTRGRALETPFSPVSPEEARGSQLIASFVLCELPKPGEVTSLFSGAAIYNFQRTPTSLVLHGGSEKQVCPPPATSPLHQTSLPPEQSRK